MARKKLNKEATLKAIEVKATNTSFMNIDVSKLYETKLSIKDIKELCDFVRIDPIYQDAGNSIIIPEFKEPKLSNCRSPFQPFS